MESNEKIGLRKNIEIDKNTSKGEEITEKTTKLVAESIEPAAEKEEGEITKETTEPIFETIESVAENNFSVTVAPNLTISEGRNRHPPVWLVDYNSVEGSSEEDEENMAFLIISDRVKFEKPVKKPKWRLAMDEEIKSIEKNQTWNLVVLPAEAKKVGVKWIYKTKLN